VTFAARGSCLACVFRRGALLGIRAGSAYMGGCPARVLEASHSSEALCGGVGDDKARWPRFAPVLQASKRGNAKSKYSLQLTSKQFSAVERSKCCYIAKSCATPLSPVESVSLLG